jgi:hypothetical protein
LRHGGPEVFTGELVSESLHILGNALELIVVRADGFAKVIPNLVATAILFDIGPVMLALVLFFGGLAPPLI